MNPPFGITSPTDWQRGFAAAQSDLLPNRSADVVYTPVVTYYVDLFGNDASGKGTQAAPYRTINRAWNDAQQFKVANPNALCGIALGCNAVGAYTENFGVNGGAKGLGGLLLTAWKQANLDDRPTLSGNNPFAFVNGCSGIHLQNLNIVAGGVPTEVGNAYQNGITVNSASDVTMDYCTVEGYRLNCDFEGVTGLRLYSNWIGRAWTTLIHVFTDDPSGQKDKSQGLYTVYCPGLDVQGNTFYRNGWNPAQVNMSNKLTYASLTYSHQYYEHDPAVPGIDRFNIYWFGGTTGHQARNGGDSAWNVYAYNGNATDAVWQNLSGSLRHFVVFGPPNNYSPSNAPFWGGGITGQCPVFEVEDGLFLSANANYLPTTPAAIILQGAPAATATLTPYASLRNLRGVWSSPLLANLDKRAVFTDGSTTRLPKVNERLPQLTDYLSASSEDAAADVLKQLHNPNYRAENIVRWANESWLATQNL